MHLLLTEKPREVLAVIPARGGSKGVPRKNLALLGGRPLLAYSIEVALKSRLITRVIVSTEDHEIAAVAREYGAEVPFLRPMEQALDHSNLSEALDFLLHTLRGHGYFPDAMVTLMPTSPFRTARLVDALTDKLLEGHQAVSTVRAIRLQGSALFHVRKGAGGAARVHLTANGHGECLRSYGVFSGAWLTPAPRGTYVHYLNDPIATIDIDTLDDLRLAERVVSDNLFDFELS
jgi:CMP-N-acetylneuraminic acid synthetase